VTAAISIRTRLLIAILTTLVVILGIAAGASYLVSQHEAEELFGARLATSARVIEALVAKQVDHATIASPLVISLPKELEGLHEDEESRVGHRYETKIAFQVWRDDGTLLVRSASAPAQPLSPNREGFSKQNVQGRLWAVFVLKSGNSWVQVAENTEVREELIENLGAALMAPLIGGALLLLVAVNVLVVYGLSPLHELAAAIKRREANALGPLQVNHVPKEMVPVVGALNDLLARTNLAFEHERRFIDAAAHELRTPLSALKIHADNVARATSDVERTRSMIQLQQGLERTTNLAEQMLAYSRAQDPHNSEARTKIHLSEAVAETIASLDPLRRQRSQTVRIISDSEGLDSTIVGEPTKIERLIRNLLDNASRYSPRSSQVDVRISQEGDSVVLSVANHGRVIPPELRERVFEPYYRIPGSESRGSGLGLAIVKEIADQHNATIRLEALHDDDGTVITVRFPSKNPAYSPLRWDSEGS